MARGSSHGDGRCPKRHTEIQDASKGLGLKRAKTIGSTHIPLTKVSHRAKPWGRGNTPLLLRATTESHPGKASGYQEGQRTEANNSINHTLKGQRTACLAALRKRPEKRATLRGALAFHLENRRRSVPQGGLQGNKHPDLPTSPDQASHMLDPVGKLLSGPRKQSSPLMGSKQVQLPG